MIRTLRTIEIVICRVNESLRSRNTNDAASDSSHRILFGGESFVDYSTDHTDNTDRVHEIGSSASSYYELGHDHSRGKPGGYPLDELECERER